MRIGNNFSVMTSQNNNTYSPMAFQGCPCRDRNNVVERTITKQRKSLWSAFKCAMTTLKNKIFKVNKYERYSPKNYAAKVYTDLRKGPSINLDGKTERYITRNSDGTYLFQEKDKKTGYLLKHETIVFHQDTGRVCEIQGHDLDYPSRLKYLIDYQGNDYPLTITEYTFSTNKRSLSIQTYPETGRPHKVKEWDIKIGDFVSTTFDTYGNVVK